MGSTMKDEEEIGFMSWIGQTWNSPSFLKSRLAFAFVVGCAATAFFTWILFQMERHNATYKAAVLEAAVGERDTQLELEEDDGEGQAEATINYVQAGKEDKQVVTIEEQDGDGLYKPGDTRRRLTTEKRVQILSHVMVLVLMNYLLLVFLPGGNVALSFVATVAVWVMALHSYLRDELRRGRYDRLVTMIALFFIIAGCLTLATYCRMALKEGSIYQGPARIVGYDDGVYSNRDGTTLRSDLEVAWGGAWGCPDEGGRHCTATVQGALCETEYDLGYEDVLVEDVDDASDDDRRVLASAQDQEEIAEKEAEDEEVYEEELDEEYEEELEEDEEEVIEEADAEVIEYEDELNEAYGEVIEEEYEGEVEYYDEAEEEEEENEVLSEETTDLEAENEELEEELEEEEEYAGELADEVAEMEGEGGVYSYEDDMFEDDYWEYDWDSVWGDYACEDLFDEDLEGQSFDADLEAGLDQWPTISIYGSCNSCEAYLMDYYSTEHFMDISLYALQSWVYLMTGFFLLMVSACCALREVIRPAQENKIVLLSHEGGVPA